MLQELKYKQEYHDNKTSFNFERLKFVRKLKYSFYLFYIVTAIGVIYDLYRSI